ncbi:hypothetical protein PAPYR_11072 [Paratrimastix pyriformis]|uniref:Uncharacterized protein n=1 Tax=Paratrimastix pyriformis TaxID=342808 RepID=A0ABQ8U9L4_9EUKA|nr:hypothetical protein PAPYR_11072 [Paratrimastix pyriformis]
MVCRLGVVAALGGDCPQVGVVCLADVSLFPGWTECFASEVGPRLILRISDIWPLRCLSDRLVRWKILLWDVVDAARSLGENVAADSVKAGQGQPGYCFELSWNGVGLVVTLGPVKGSTVKPGPLTPAAVLRVLERGGRWATVEDNLAKMWQANLTEWYEENPDGDNLKKEENPAVGDNLKGHRWATSAGWGTDTEEENPKGDNLKKEENPKGDNLKKEENPKGDNLKKEENPKGDNLKKEENPKGDNLKKEENPAEGDNLMREGAEENPDFGENLDGGMEDDAGDGNAAQAGDIGGILLWLRWLGLASFWLTVCENVFLVAVCLVDSFEFRQCSWDREVWKGRLARISWLQVIMYAWGDLEGLACQANWNFIVDRFKRWVGMKEGWKRGWADIDLAEF